MKTNMAAVLGLLILVGGTAWAQNVGNKASVSAAQTTIYSCQQGYALFLDEKGIFRLKNETANSSSELDLIGPGRISNSHIYKGVIIPLNSNSLKGVFVTIPDSMMDGPEFGSIAVSVNSDGSADIGYLCEKQ